MIFKAVTIAATIATGCTVPAAGNSLNTVLLTMHGPLSILAPAPVVLRPPIVVQAKRTAVVTHALMHAANIMMDLASVRRKH